MKNLAILFLVLGIGFLFGGYYLMQNNLNNKPIVLTCSRTASDDNYSATISYKFNYRGRNIDTINYIVDFDYSNVSDDDFNEVSNIDVCTQLKNELDSKDLKFSVLGFRYGKLFVGDKEIYFIKNIKKALLPNR